MKKNNDDAMCNHCEHIKHNSEFSIRTNKKRSKRLRTRVRALKQALVEITSAHDLNDAKFIANNILAGWNDDEFVYRSKMKNQEVK